MLSGSLFKAITLPEAERLEWEHAITDVMNNDLKRADLISFFAVVVDMIRQGSVKPAAFSDWNGRIVVLSAENDPTQSEKDFPRYESCLGVL